MNTPTPTDKHRTHTVHTDDGVPLTVHECGEATAPLTVVFVHGHCLAAAAWEHQIAHLQRARGTKIRTVTYDQRGHGESGHAPMDTYTITQLGSDLHAVLTAVGAGPTILVGHSMGGMAIMSYLDQNPTAARARIVGAALISTASSDLTLHGLGRSLNSPFVGAVRTLVDRAPGTADRLRRLGKHVSTPLIDGFGYGIGTTAQMRKIGTALLTEVDIATMVGFLDSLKHHDERNGLRHLRAVPVEVICGDIDLMTPPVHSHAIAALTGSEVTIVDGAGHMVIHERPTRIGMILDGLIDRVATSTATTRAARRSGHQGCRPTNLKVG
ncbi:MAG: alpha/beta hydrolase [Rhodococcus sp.]|nr:alpha/beta hydrolase [Rhodococcus sp. (in: high G+C Gram-positive bacteria)]